jgi:hypothetical protein
MIQWQVLVTMVMDVHIQLKARNFLTIEVTTSGSTGTMLNDIHYQLHNSNTTAATRKFQKSTFYL